MKEKLKKFTLTILTVLLSFNTLIASNVGNIVQAQDVQTQTSQTQEEPIDLTTTSLNNELDMLDNNAKGWGETLGDVLLGIVLYIPKAMAFAIVSLVRTIAMLLSAIDNSNATAAVSIESILFNDYNITHIDFFSGIDGTSTMATLKQSVAKWYYSIRNIAIVILLGILLYVGIRMAISTVAEEEAKYKKMMKDWIVSIVLIFVLHYIMIFTIEINDVLVNIIGAARPRRRSTSKCNG